jgi:hypothetical protein
MVTGTTSSCRGPRSGDRSTSAFAGPKIDHIAMFRSARKFQLWEYWVSHSQLVLRSVGDLRCTPGTSEARNIDLSFVNVDYIELPTLMRDLEITDATMEECQRVGAVVEREVSPEEVFVIVSSGRRHLLVAGRLDVSENDMALNKTTVDR